MKIAREEGRGNRRGIEVERKKERKKEVYRNF